MENLQKILQIEDLQNDLLECEILREFGRLYKTPKIEICLEVLVMCLQNVEILTTIIQDEI